MNVKYHTLKKRKPKSHGARPSSRHSAPPAPPSSPRAQEEHRFRPRTEQGQEKQKIMEYAELFQRVKKELSKAVVGQQGVIDGLLRGILCNGHVLLEGVPGIAKTLIVRSLASVTGGGFSRIQFTADLLPTDITGLTVYEEKLREFKVIKGPVFANYLLADEINRSPPKTQSALLEAMQEKQVTIGTTTYPLPKPFFVMATQNPIEQGGVYNLPEAQVDRFLFKILINYPKMEEELEILHKNMTLKSFDAFALKPVVGPEKIVEMQNTVRDIYLSDEIAEYIVRIVDATRNPGGYGLEKGKFIGIGSSPRASIALFIGGKAQALMKKSSFVTPGHVKDVAFGVLRHRILLNYEGQAENVTADDIIKEILHKVPSP